jgi:outer membrane protein assembly factor BamB
MPMRKTRFLSPVGRFILTPFALTLLVSSPIYGGTPAEDWPQFHGPRCDNISRETGLLKRWPEGGPELLWKADGIGHGWATVSIADGRIYTAGNIGERTVVTTLDLNGKPLWQQENGRAYNRHYPGARGTPTIAGGRVYHLNGDGDAACLDAKTGSPIWSVNILKRFNGRNIQWGLAESLTVDGQKVICCPGGEEIGVVALDKDSGETIWTCTGIGDKPAYTTGIIVDYGGLRQFITTMSGSTVGIEIESGRLLWQRKQEAPYDVNVATPVYHDGHVAVSTTWGRGTTLLKLNVDGKNCTVEKVWYNSEFDVEHGGFVFVDGHFYALADGNHKRRHWTCVDWKTGRKTYDATGPGKRSAATSYADGMLYLLGDDRTVALVPATPETFEVVSQFELPEGPEGPTWAHPVIHGGRLYLRHSEWLYAFDLK